LKCQFTSGWRCFARTDLTALQGHRQVFLDLARVDPCHRPEARPITVALNPGLGRFSSGYDKWGKLNVDVSGQQIKVNVRARNAAVIALR
jgi:hypothetical protein